MHNTASQDLETILFFVDLSKHVTFCLSYKWKEGEDTGFDILCILMKYIYHSMFDNIFTFVTYSWNTFTFVSDQTHDLIDTSNCINCPKFGYFCYSTKGYHYYCFSSSFCDPSLYRTLRKAQQLWSIMNK